MEKLICAVQMYDWGRQGSQSEVATLMHAADKQFVIDETKPYAELWMGVHPNGPSKLVSDGKLLSEKIAKSKFYLGDHEGGSLQFLFKVLSVNKALSIQSHPDKEKAKILHNNDPAHYPDSNHKPEMAIALSDFQLLSGFRPFHEICDNIKAFPELWNLVTSKGAIEKLETGNDYEKREALKEIFSEYMHSSKENISKAVQQLAVRLKNKDGRSDLEELLLRLNSEYPGDVGVFAPLLMNYFTLREGDAVFMGPNSPHAYLLGDCVECMACSDNTIRAGLTSKFKDVNTLCSDLTFEMIQPPYFTPKNIGPGIREYAPPVQEFAVHELRGEAGELRDVGASSIIIVIKGSTEIYNGAENFKASRGEIYFVPANICRVNIKPSGDFLAYRAFTPKR
ncbi:phosphomannose isomerase type I [Loa loa]|uniref:mannose-6-phosphate isomerase n=1 Tax=Loa loa TaxID=7209 RepID=A0A1I7VET6_LOALO|nr:phosphomannose isomerase type I [Loa loa]EFO27140.1 phosphomannose isomerase type I [Loa loa]